MKWILPFKMLHKLNSFYFVFRMLYLKFIWCVTWNVQYAPFSRISLTWSPVYDDLKGKKKTQINRVSRKQFYRDGHRSTKSEKNGSKFINLENQTKHKCTHQDKYWIMLLWMMLLVPSPTNQQQKNQSTYLAIHAEMITVLNECLNFKVCKICGYFLRYHYVCDKWTQAVNLSRAVHEDFMTFNGVGSIVAGSSFAHYDFAFY